jgi:hypothetical protein
MRHADCARERDGSPAVEAEGDSRAGHSSVVEQLDDRLRKARELVERGNKRFSYGDPLFIDRYREGACYLGLRRAFGDERQLGFVVAAYPAGRKSLDRNTSDPEHCWGWLYSKQPTMFAHDVELMEGPQKFVPSAIWVQRFDDLSVGSGKPQPLFAFETFEWIDKVMERAKNREVGFGVIRHAVARIQCAGEDIKAAADRVDVSTDLPTWNARGKGSFSTTTMTLLGLCGSGSLTATSRLSCSQQMIRDSRDGSWASAQSMLA